MISKSAWSDLDQSDREVNLSPVTISHWVHWLILLEIFQSNIVDEKQFNTEVGHLCPLQAGNLEMISFVFWLFLIIYQATAKLIIILPF